MRVHKNGLIIILGLIILLNPILAFYQNLVLFFIVLILVYQKQLSQIIYIFIFLSTFTLIVRWNVPEDYIAASFRSIFILLILSLFAYTSALKPYRFIKSTGELLLMFFTLLTVLMIFIHWESFLYAGFVVRDYLLVLLLYPIFNYLLNNNKLNPTTLLKFYYAGVVITAAFNILFYLGILEFPFKALALHQNETPEIRSLFGIELVRMSSISGGSAGGITLMYFSTLFLGIYLPRKNQIQKIIYFISLVTLSVAVILLISFSAFLVVFSFLFSYIIFNSKFSAKTLLVFTLSFAIFFILISSRISINIGEQKLTLLKYIFTLTGNYFQPLFENLSIKEFFLGIGFDVKSGNTAIETRTVTRDLGLASAIVSHGFFGFILILLIYLDKLIKLFRLRNSTNKSILIGVSTILCSSIFFLHGLSVITRPTDIMVLVSIVLVDFYFYNDKKVQDVSRLGKAISKKNE